MSTTPSNTTGDDSYSVGRVGEAHRRVVHPDLGAVARRRARTRAARRRTPRAAGRRHVDVGDRRARHDGSVRRAAVRRASGAAQTTVARLGVEGVHDPFPRPDVDDAVDDRRRRGDRLGGVEEPRRRQPGDRSPGRWRPQSVAKVRSGVRPYIGQSHAGSSASARGTSTTQPASRCEQQGRLTAGTPRGRRGT